MVYATIGARDLAEALVFYDAVMATIGWRRHADFPTSSAYSLDGSGEGFTLWVCRPFDGGTASAGNGAMIGFPAPSQEAVEAFYTTALRLGGRDEGAPGLRLHYGPQVYVAYVRDLSGNKLSVVHSGVCGCPRFCKAIFRRSGGSALISFVCQACSRGSSFATGRYAVRRTRSTSVQRATMLAPRDWFPRPEH